jgi:peptidylprolyl isomerase
MSSDYRNGVSVSAARINADAIDDIVVSAGRGGGTLRETYNGRIDAGANALLRRDAVFAEIAGTSPPLFSAPVDLDGDQIADRFFQILGEQGTQTNPGIRVTGPNGGPILQSLTQLNYSQRIAASRVGKAPNRTYAASGLSFEDLQVGTGATPAANGNVVVRYVASRMTGGVLAENLSAPQASSLRLDSFDAPSGLRNALASMRVGGIRRIMLPAGLQAGPLPGIGSTTAAVVLEIELVATNA